MSAIYTVDNLLGSLKNRGLSPTSQNTFTTDQFIQVLSEEMMTNLVPILDSVSEEYFVTNYDYAFDPSVSVYAIPPRAVAGKLRDVVFVDNNGLEIKIPRLRPELIKTMAFTFTVNPWGFYLRDNSVVLYLSTNASATATAYPTLRLKYLRRPNILTSSANCGQILSINSNTVTLSAAGSTWTASDTFDIISNSPNFVSRGDDLAVTAINGFDVTFSALPSSAAVGDWVALANYAPIPQIPVEAHLILAQYGAAKVLEAMGDFEGMGAALQKAETMKAQFLQLITPRVDGSPISLASYNGMNEAMEQGGLF